MLNPDTRHFTWRRSCPEIKCRLDFFLISSSLIPALTNADILTGFKSDHSLITLTLMNNSNPRGPGFWKLNASLLADAEYVDLIRKTINEVAREYQNNNEVEAILLWDTMKMKIRSSSLCYARQQKNKMSSKEKYSEEKITHLEKRLDEANVTATEKQKITEEISIINLQRDEISECKPKDAIIRSRARWYNDGEKNTKYFLNLGKRHSKQKTIKCLHLSDNEVVNIDGEILKEAKSFYQKLYSSTVSSTNNQCDEIFFPLGNIETLIEREQNECGCLLTEAECWESLKSMQPNKSPGTDGLSLEFYKVFWKDISFYLLNALNRAHMKGCLSITQRRGIITLIPKTHKPVNIFKNWRPITRLNYDYKIASKCIANRIQKVLPKLINNDQTGFLKGRFIGENIRLIDGIIHYANTKQIPGLLLFIDFEKCFDSIEWAFIEKTLNYYNFGSSLVAWFRLFYSDNSSCVQNNGWASDFFALSRGVRQGCPSSPYLFLLCVEIVGSAVRNDNEIRGFKVLDTESKISQYADDRTLILNGSESSFSRSLSLLDTLL